jgi:hypothetical protein
MPFTPNKIGNQSWISIDARKAQRRSGFGGLKIFFHPPPALEGFATGNGAASGAGNPTRM